ncbi:oxidoreductase [Sphingomonas lenta]|uniref:Oxidoreductase n=1 Tax=Sphingomonas lenta TaxID=1141887 RepID=A0A2A2SET0_9SPHN|nr:oxidoreductase [Sphingomonas lenta]PAX07767.1 oxidoreductase [Sphingomonas lenta]
MIRVGLIGYGLAGSAFHAPLVAAEPRMRLAAVASSRPDAVRAALPDVAVVADADALVADPSVDLVVVATPNQLHAPLARATLETGKHVVVDKPFVTDPAEGEALIDLARERGRVLSVFHNRRWDGDFLTVEKLVRAGVLGDVMLAEFCWDRFRPDIKRGWREQPGDGAGLLADLGPHLVDQAFRLFGPPQAVRGDVAAQRGQAAVDDWFDLTLFYGRTRVRLSASTLVADPRPRFALHGTKGGFVKYGIDPQEARLRAGGSISAPGFGEDGDDLRGRLTIGDAAPERVPTERGDWRRFYAGVADAILDGAPPPVDPAEALAGLRLLELARRSAAEGRTLPLG